MLGTVWSPFVALVRVISGALLRTVEVGRVLARHSIGEYLEVTTLEAIAGGGSITAAALLVAGETLALLLVRVMILRTFILAYIVVPVSDAFVADVRMEAVAGAPFAPRMTFATEHLSVH